MATKKKQQQTKPPRSATEPMPRVAVPALDDTQPAPGIFIGEGGGAGINIRNVHAGIDVGGGNLRITTQPAPRNPWTSTGFGVPGGVASTGVPNVAPTPHPWFQRTYPSERNEFTQSAPAMNLTRAQAQQVIASLNQWMPEYAWGAVVVQRVQGLLSSIEDASLLAANTVGAFGVISPVPVSAASFGQPMHALGLVVENMSGRTAPAIIGLARLKNDLEALSGLPRTPEGTLIVGWNAVGINSDSIIRRWEAIFG